jgi:hypothetical protein
VARAAHVSRSSMFGFGPILGLEKGISMTVLSFVLFAHIVATLGLFAGLAIEWLILLALRRTATLPEARNWTEIWPKLLPLTIASAALLIISGIYLATRTADWSQGWVQVSTVALFLIAPLGALAGRRVRTIHGDINRNGNRAETIHPESRVGLLGTFIVCRTTIALGVVMLMTIKPNLTDSVAVIAVSLAAGLVYGFGSRNIPARQS